MKVYKLAFYAKTLYESAYEKEQLFSTEEKARKAYKNDWQKWLDDFFNKRSCDYILCTLTKKELDYNEEELIEVLEEWYSKEVISLVSHDADRYKNQDLQEQVSKMKKHQKPASWEPEWKKEI